MSKKKPIAKGLGASALAIATLASGLSFGAASATAAEPTQSKLGEVSGEIELIFKDAGRFVVPSGWNAGLEAVRYFDTLEKASASSLSKYNVRFAESSDGSFALERGGKCLSFTGFQGDGRRTGQWDSGATRYWVNGPYYNGSARVLVADKQACDTSPWRYKDGQLTFGSSGVKLGGFNLYYDHMTCVLAYDPISGAVGCRVGTNRWKEYISNYGFVKGLASEGLELVGEHEAIKPFAAEWKFQDGRDEKSVISGKGKPDSSIAVKNADGVEVATATTDAEGNFSVEVPAPNKGGEYALTVEQTDDAGAKTEKKITLDYGTAVAVETPADQSEVSDSPITVEGKGEAGSEVTVVVNGTDVAPVTVKDNGTWTKAVNIRKGENTIGATQKSKGANTTTSTVVVNPGESANDALSVNVDSVDNDARTALVSGTATAGAQIRVGSTVVATAAADGSWSGRVSGLKAGANTVEFVQYVGGERVDAVSKDIRVVATGFELTSPQNNDVIRTADKSVTFTGLGNPGGKVSVLNGNKPIGSAIVDADGKWSFTSLMAYTEYDLEVYYKKIPTGAVTNKVPLHITVTNNEQNAPFEITAPKHNSTVTAPDNQVWFEGTGTTGGVVTIKKGTNTVGTAEVGADGTWAFTGELSFNKHNLTAYYKKMPGSSAVSSPLTVTVTDGSVVLPFEVTSPANDSVVETADKSVTFTGQGAGGGKVVIKKGNATLAEGLVDSKGKWSLTGTLNYGEQEVTVFHKPVGGSQAQQVRLNLIVQAPAADFAIESPANGDTVAAGPVTFTGVGKEGTTVSVFVNGKSRGTATVENGTWTLQTTAIGAGTHDFVVYHKQGAIAAESETVRLTLR